MSVIQNKLSVCLPNWQKIGASEKLLQWVKFGVPVPFWAVPLKIFEKNPKFCVAHQRFIQGEIKSLLSKGAIEKCVVKPDYISPLNVVPKKHGKYRLIHNLRKLNENIVAPKFRHEDIRTTVELLDFDDNICTLDIKDCFHHIPVHKDFMKYLGFKFEGKFYRWCVLPFGLSISPYYCSKFIRPIIG